MNIFLFLFRGSVLLRTFFFFSFLLSFFFFFAVARGKSWWAVFLCKQSFCTPPVSAVTRRLVYTSWGYIRGYFSTFQRGFSVLSYMLFFSTNTAVLALSARMSVMRNMSSWGALGNDEVQNNHASSYIFHYLSYDSSKKKTDFLF